MLPGALVNAVAEREMPVGNPVEVQLVWLTETARITVCGRQRDGHTLAGLDEVPRQLHVLKRGAENTEVKDRKIPQQLLDSVFHEAGIRAELRYLVWVGKQHERSQPQHVRDGLMTGGKQQDAQAGQFVLAERPGRRQVAQQVIGGIGTLFSDQPAQEVGSARMAAPPSSAVTWRLNSVALLRWTSPRSA